jgi:hypothetical protein
MKTNSDNPAGAILVAPGLSALVANAIGQVASSDNPAILAGLEEALTKSALVDIHGLRPAVFGDKAPSIRTLRSLTRQRIIPHFRIGKLIRYDVRLVRAALEQRCLIQARKSGGCAK